jgi:hypothetical protein
MSKARDLANAGTALTTVSATELGYLDGVTSAVQTQIDSKIGAASAINPTIVDAKGDIIAATAADTVARLAVGANDTVLTADSTAATGLKWATPAAGGMTSLASGSLTSTSVNLTGISSSYVNLVLFERNVSWTSDDRFRFTFNNAGSGYYYVAANNTSTSAASFYVENNIGQIYSNQLDSADNNNACVLTIYDYANTTANKMFSIQLTAKDETNSFFRNQTMFGFLATTAAIDRIDLISSTGFAAGTYELYGVK